MARRRYLSTKISTDTRVNKLAQQSDFAALLYMLLIPHAEDDATLPTSDPDELLMLVVPGRRDKTPQDITDAIQLMIQCGLLENLNGNLRFPPKAFYQYQTYIPAAKRAENQRETPQIAEERRESPQKAASPSPSPSPSLSLKPDRLVTTTDLKKAARETLKGQSNIRNVNAVINHMLNDPDQRQELTDRILEQRKAALVAAKIGACGRCDRNGWRLETETDGRTVSVKCDHKEDT